jgi:tetratricopeptide (TPR) repeat protein
MQRALEIRRAVLPDPHYEIAVSLNNIATALLAQRRAAEAEPLLRESLAMRRALFGAEHPQIAAAIHNLGAALDDLGREQEAIAHYQEGLAMRRRLLGEQHLDVALSLSSLAVLHHERGRCREALPLFVEALPIWRGGLGEEHGIVLKTRGYVGDCLAGTGQRAEAERELLAAHEALVRTVGESHAETQRVRRFLRALYEDWGRPADAARYATEGAGS